MGWVVDCQVRKVNFLSKPIQAHEVVLKFCHGWMGRRTSSNEFVPQVNGLGGRLCPVRKVNFLSKPIDILMDCNGLDGDSNRLGLGLVSVSGAML